MLKVIVCAPVPAFASSIACLSEPAPASLVLLTTSTDESIVRLQPPFIFPTSAAVSSTTYKLHVPFGLVPLKPDKAAGYGPAGAGAGNGSPGSKSVGLNVPVTI